MPKRLAHSSLSALAMAAVALAIPAVALALNTSVVPYKTVAGIPLKLTPAQVVKRLGKPSHTIRVSGKIAEYDYAKLALSIQFDTLHQPDASDFVGVAVGPASVQINYRTVHGIHIGSTEAQVKRAFPQCHIKLDGCAMWLGTPGADGSYSFNLQFEQGKLSEMDNQYVFNDA